MLIPMFTITAARTLQGGFGLPVRNLSGHTVKIARSAQSVAALAPAFGGTNR